MHRTISYNKHTNHSPVNPLRSHITLQSRRTGLLLSSLNERNSTRTSAENRTKRPERSTATTEYDYDNPRFRHSIPPIPLPPPPQPKSDRSPCHQRIGFWRVLCCKHQVRNRNYAGEQGRAYDPLPVSAPDENPAKPETGQQQHIHQKHYLCTYYMFIV